MGGATDITPSEGARGLHAGSKLTCPAHRPLQRVPSSVAPFGRNPPRKQVQARDTQPKESRSPARFSSR